MIWRSSIIGDSQVPRRGVHIVLDNFGTARHIVLSGLYIHDVNGTNTRKDDGGIIFRRLEASLPAALTICESKETWCGSGWFGIAAQS